MSQVIEQRIGSLLANLGLLPFFALAMASWIPFGDRPARFVLLALVGYAAVILSFLGAVHWGLTLLTPQLNKAQAWNTLGWSVLPALLGWLVLLLVAGGALPWLVLLVLLGDFLVCRLMDGALWRLYPAAPSWYLPLRTRLTAGAMLALTIALFAYL